MEKMHYFGMVKDGGVTVQISKKPYLMEEISPTRQ